MPEPQLHVLLHEAACYPCALPRLAIFLPVPLGEELTFPFSHQLQSLLLYNQRKLWSG